MNRLKILRKEKGLSQQALAKEIGVSYRTLQNWENGVNTIKPDKAQVLADYFGVSIAYLLGYDVVLKSIENKTDGAGILANDIGVLLVDVPEPKYYKYSYIELNEDRNSFCIESVDSASLVSQFGYKCTKDESKKYPQFRWVSLEEL